MSNNKKTKQQKMVIAVSAVLAALMFLSAVVGVISML